MPPQDLSEQQIREFYERAVRDNPYHPFSSDLTTLARFLRRHDEHRPRLSQIPRAAG